MKLVNRPGRILARSFSMWCVYMAGALEIAPYVVPYLDDWIPRWLSIVFLLASPLARIIPQASISGDNE